MQQEEMTKTNYDWDLEVKRGIAMKLDADLEKLNERESFVEKVVETNFDEFELGMKMLVSDNRQFSQQKVPRALDWMGTYLLKSKDIESCRKLENYTFYYDETDMKRGKIAACTVSVDLEASRNLHGNKSVFDEDPFDVRVERLVNRLRLDQMDSSQKKKLIKMGLKHKDKVNDELQEVMQELYQIICEGVWKETDIEIIDMMILGYKEKEIASLLGESQQATHKKINRIVQRIGKWNADDEPSED